MTRAKAAADKKRRNAKATKKRQADPSVIPRGAAPMRPPKVPPPSESARHAETKKWLLNLVEELAEAQQAAAKLMRFGLGSTNPETGVPNRHKLAMEVGNVMACSRRLHQLLLLDKKMTKHGMDDKLMKVEEFGR